MPSRSFPPGPKGSWVRGASPLKHGNPLDVLTGWARHYGDVVSWRALHIRIFMLNHPADIETVLLTNSRSFKKGRGLQANRELFGNGLLTSEGEFWLRQRRLVQPVFQRGHVATHWSTIVSRATRALNQWKDGETRDVHRDLMRLTLDIAAETLFGVNLSHESERVEAAIGALMAANMSPTRLYPLVRRLPTPGNRRYSRAVGELDRIVRQIIKGKRAKQAQRGDASDGPSGGAVEEDDFLSRLLQARDTDGTRMTDRQLRDECITILLAGHETTAIALSWALYLLAQNPAVEEKLHAELDGALAGRAPTGADVTHLAYTESVLRESLRLYPPAWLMPRLALEDCEIRNYRISKGASVLMSQWIVHRDPRYFPDPERFDPDRWTESFARNLPRFAYFPFGGGPRLCVGNSFALLEGTLLLASIAQRFRFRLAGAVPVEPQPSITLRPRGGVHLTLSKRR